MNNENQAYSSYSFPGQRSGETIELIIRKYKLVLFSEVFLVLIMAFAPIAFYFIIIPSALPAFLVYPYNRIYMLISLTYYGFLWIGTFILWVDYYMDVLIVTNERLIDVQQAGLFSRIVSELDLRRIQDITSEVNGPLETIFGFGDVYIQTASEDNRFKMRSIPNPVETRRKITDLYNAAIEKDKFIFSEKDK